MLYKNESEEVIRQFVVEFSSLNEQAEKENFSHEQYIGILYGFESAIRLILGNYNIFPKQTPVDSMQETEKFAKLIEENLNQEEQRQNQEMGLKNVK
jgi:hypothetical protein